jgi:hypothetical protein
MAPPISAARLLKDSSASVKVASAGNRAVKTQNKTRKTARLRREDVVHWGKNTGISTFIYRNFRITSLGRKNAIHGVFASAVWLCQTARLDTSRLIKR